MGIMKFIEFLKSLFRRRDDSVDKSTEEILEVADVSLPLMDENGDTLAENFKTNEDMEDEV